MTDIVRTAVKARRERNVDVLDIQFTSWNPERRTSDNAAMRQLQADLASVGQLENIHLQRTSKGVLNLIDGNRRVTALRENGAHQVRAYIYETDDQEVVEALFVYLNHGKVAINKAQQLEAALKGGPVFNTAAQRALDTIIAMFGSVDSIPIVAQGRLNGMSLGTAARIVNYVYSEAEAGERGSKKFLAKQRSVVLWMVRNEQQQKSIAYMRLGYDPKNLRKAVEANSVTPRLG